MTNAEDTSEHETGPGATVGSRITGEDDPRDPDGLITLDDLPDRLGSTSNLHGLVRKASQYGNPTAQETSSEGNG